MLTEAVLKRVLLHIYPHRTPQEAGATIIPTGEDLSLEAMPTWPRYSGSTQQSWDQIHFASLLRGLPSWLQPVLPCIQYLFRTNKKALERGEAD